MSDKVSRTGMRVDDLLHIVEDDPKIKSFNLQFNFDVIKSMTVDSVTYLNDALKAGKRIMAEGANALFLDIDFGSYPFVTSTSCCAGGICSGLGIPPSRVGETIGIMKSYLTRVGNGPMPTELSDKTGKRLQKVGHEYGTTTERPRRCGWLDIPMMRYSHMINGYTCLAMTKLDVLSGFDTIKVCEHYIDLADGSTYNTWLSDLKLIEKLKPAYKSFKGWNTDISNVRKFEDLPTEARDYVNAIEVLVDIPIKYIGVGADREAIIVREYPIAFIG